MQDSEARSKRSVRPLMRWLLIGGVVGVVGTLILFAVRQRDPIPPLQVVDFYAARQRWETEAPENYDIAVTVRGSQPADYRVEVRDGEAVAAWRNERPLQQPRTFLTWSVPGMFGTMLRDVEAVEQHAAKTAAPNTPQLTLRASFDPKYGYPAQYRRIEWGSTVDVKWQVTKFELHEESSKLHVPSSK